VAHCDEFISRFEDGLDTVIGERGVKLSPAASVSAWPSPAPSWPIPRILILDEATSSLDSESEAMIRDGINTLRRGRTTFVIAHRLSTIRSADQILVLDEGRVVERGTHHELLAPGRGLYRRLYDRSSTAMETDRFVNPGEEFVEA
jgi:ABC-type multidrug transport system fused ATPase/permease subunit